MTIALVGAGAALTVPGKLINLNQLPVKVPGSVRLICGILRAALIALLPFAVAMLAAVAGPQMTGLIHQGSRGIFALCLAPPVVAIAVRLQAPGRQGVSTLSTWGQSEGQPVQPSTQTVRRIGDSGGTGSRR